MNDSPIAGLALGSDQVQCLLTQAPDALIFADCNGMIQVWNDKATGVFGFTPSEAIGSHLDLIIPEELRNQHWTGFRRATKLGHTQSKDKRLVTPALHKDRRALFIDLRFSIALDTAGGVLGAIAIARDVTRQFLAEEAALAFELHVHTGKAPWYWTD